MRIHLIAIGGAVMHNLAINLASKGHEVSGSDDEIYNPAKTNLADAGLLPKDPGWHKEKITPNIDIVILGMHARPDNPELLEAKSLGLKIQSFPEFIYEHSKNKQRIVIAGSHGKTTTTSMIMHVLKKSGKDFDYLVGAKLEGFKTMVRLSTAPLIVIEGDEYLSSAIDLRPKFLHYHPHIAVITGIAWDHINVFPTFERYRLAFEQFIKSMEKQGTLFYFENDIELQELVAKDIPPQVSAVPYNSIPHEYKEGMNTILAPNEKKYQVSFFGEHNMQNLQAARKVCTQTGISDEEFFNHIATFSGAARRQQKLMETNDFCCWLDFAHAPSKAAATTRAVRRLFPERKLVACLELHTYSSLNKNFLPAYKKTLEHADIACIFYNPLTLKMKKMPAINSREIEAAFNHHHLFVFTGKKEFSEFLSDLTWNDSNLLFMGSGNYAGLNLKQLAVNLKMKKENGQRPSQKMEDI